MRKIQILNTDNYKSTKSYLTMAPKRNKKKSKFDEEFDEEKESKWEKALEEANEDNEEGDAEQMYAGRQRATYEYDFTNASIIPEDKPEPPPRDPLAHLTPEQIEMLKKIQQKQRLDKQRQQKLKNEKRKERKKQKEIQKQKQRIEKQKQAEEDRKVEAQLKKVSKKSSPWIIPLLLLCFIIFMGFMQYQTELHAKLSKFRLDEEQNFYDILELDSSANQNQIKQKYKQLVLKYHPDRNPSCKQCPEIFDKIMKAYDILSSPEKRQAYDQNSGYISEIKSQAVTLTPNNYGWLVQQSTDVWFVQVYDSTDRYARYFSQFWEQIVDEYGDVVEFGRIDVWRQSDMLSYIPYRFQVFPGLYLIDKGYSELCPFDFEKPIQSMRMCIEKHFENLQYDTSTFSEEELPTTPTILVPQKLKSSLRLKAIHKQHENHLTFTLHTNPKAPQTIEAIIPQGKTHNRFTFSLKNPTKSTFKQYHKFLSSLYVEQLSVCRFLYRCLQEPCIIVLKDDLSYEKEPKIDLPVVRINEEGKMKEEIVRVKEVMDLHEDFDLALYEEGRVEFGYLEELQLMLSEGTEDGQVIRLECQRSKTYLKMLWQLITSPILYLLSFLI